MHFLRLLGGLALSFLGLLLSDAASNLGCLLLRAHDLLVNLLELLLLDWNLSGRLLLLNASLTFLLLLAANLFLLRVLLLGGLRFGTLLLLLLALLSDALTKSLSPSRLALKVST
jgi:hypothetical protein